MLSVSELTNTFDLLSLVDFVVDDLFLIDSGLEPVQNTLDGVEWASGLQLVLDFQHDGHDVSSVGEFEGVLLSVESLGGD